MRELTLTLVLVLLSCPVHAQDGIARELSAIASDGTTIRIGEVGGRIELVPARRGGDRFGRIRVHSGLVFEARAGARAVLPAFVTGSIGGVVEIAAGVSAARVDALRARGDRTLARIAIGDATILDAVPIEADTVRVEGAALEPYSLSWRHDGSHVLARGRTELCVSPGERCVTLINRVSLPLSEVRGREGAWSSVVAETDGIRLEGWVRTRRVSTSSEPSGGAVVGALGIPGPLSDGCPYDGRPALVAAGTGVHLRPGGAIWAHLPDDPDSVAVHDTRPGTPWVEITAAPGVQRSYPGSTCSLGWVPRVSVSWDVLRRDGVELASGRRGARPVAVVRAAPAWLLEVGVQLGDAIVGAVVRGTTRPASNLDQLRRELGIGGTFVVERGGAERTVRVPLAAHCREPGGAQPSACHPR